MNNANPAQRYARCWTFFLSSPHAFSRMTWDPPSIASGHGVSPALYNAFLVGLDVTCEHDDVVLTVQVNGDLIASGVPASAYNRLRLHTSDVMLYGAGLHVEASRTRAFDSRAGVVDARCLHASVTCLYRLEPNDFEFQLG